MDATDEQARRETELWKDYLDDAMELAREAYANCIPPFQILLQDIRSGLSKTLNCRYIGIGPHADGRKVIIIVTPDLKIRDFDAMQYRYTLLK